MKKFFTTALGLLASARATKFSEYEEANFNLPQVSPDEFEQLWVENPIDHFNYQDNRTYLQRFWKNDKYFDEEKGNVFLYTCGEYTCSIRSDRLYPYMVGAKKGALLLALEHRFYGKSQPFNDWNTENFRYLSSEQALADIAGFL